VRPSILYLLTLRRMRVFSDMVGEVRNRMFQSLRKAALLL